jgi:hypothetical protein
VLCGSKKKEKQKKKEIGKKKKDSHKKGSTANPAQYAARSSRDSPSWLESLATVKKGIKKERVNKKRDQQKRGHGRSTRGAEASPVRTPYARRFCRDHELLFLP